MKFLFPGYYKLTNVELRELWERCNFVLDTNTLLNLFRYPKETSNVMLKLLESIKDRIWIPHQVALEYHRNLETVLYEQKNEYETLEKECMSELSKLISKFKKLRHSHISTNTMVQTLEQSSEIIRKELSNQREQQPDLQEIKKRINNLVGENIGSQFEQAELVKIFAEGAQRYGNKVPPGYMDSKKNFSYLHNGIEYQAAYGDLIFWKQTLKYAQNKEVSSIILVSDDRKEDWILEVSGEKKGIHPYLTNEFHDQSKGKLFNSYNSVQFISEAEHFLGFKSSAIVSDVIKEIETVYSKADSFKDSENLTYNNTFKEKYNYRERLYDHYLEDKKRRIGETEFYFYKFFFDVSKSFVETEERNSNSVYNSNNHNAFPVILKKIVKDYIINAEIVEIKYEGEFLTVIVATPFEFEYSSIDNLAEAISKEMNQYYTEETIRLLRIFV